MKTMIYEGDLKGAYEAPAGYDLPCKRIEFLNDFNFESGLLEGRIFTGVKLQLPNGIFGVIKPRSSALRRGFIVIEGVIDSDYRGELIIQFLATEKAMEELKKDNIKSFAQIVFFNSPQIRLVKGAVAKETKRGTKGFGSSDKEEK